MFHEPSRYSGSMPSNERIRKYLDAGNVVGRVQRGRAEEIVRELVNAGDIRRDQAQEWVDAMVDRSRNSSEQLLETVRKEVAAQLKKIDTSSLEHIAEQVADILKRSADAGRSATKTVSTRAEKTATDVRKQAGRAATDVRKQAEKTAKKARAAAEKVTPERPPPRQAHHRLDQEGRGQEEERRDEGRRQEGAAKKAATKKEPSKKASSKKASSKKAAT